MVLGSAVTGNSAEFSDSGGGITNLGTLAVIDCTLSENLGGGIVNFESGTLTVTGSILTGNSATFLGGGIANLGMSEVTGSTLSGNSAGDGGGGIANCGPGILTVTGSILSGNSSTGNGGGGIANFGTAEVFAPGAD
jgi:hypothetical protein